MLWNVRPDAPMSVLTTLRAMPVVLVIELPVPVTLIVPLVSALMPRPLVVSMSRPPPERVSVWPSLVVMLTASVVVLLIVLVALLNVVEPPVLPDRMMPPPASLVSAIGPDNVTVPPLRPVISTVVTPVPLLRLPG